MKRRGQSRRIKKKNRRVRTRNSPAFSPISPERQYIFFRNSVSEAVKYFKQITVDAGISYEICATIARVPSDNSWMLKLHHKGEPSGDITNDRNSCTFQGYEQIILHNHPDKYYPSREDIDKVLKNKHRNIRESYIACKFGIWRFVVEPDNKLTDSELETLKPQGKHALDDFYRHTVKGREYNEMAVEILCQEIYEIYGIRLDFYPGDSYQQTDEVRF
jgi:hypothetical protein